MRDKVHRGLAAVAVVASAVVAAGVATRATATVMTEFALEDMVRDADAIVVGVVERTGVQLAIQPEGGLEPHTVTQLRVSQWLKGDASPHVTIRERGGVHQEIAMRVDGAPTYAVGDEVLVLLERHPEHPRDYRTYGMVQGKFVVRRGVGGVPTTVRRDLRAVSFASWASGDMTVQRGAAEPAMALDALKDLIVATLALGRAE